jgi:anti-anti-sigma factor
MVNPHKVFPSERAGLTLVVAPRGDAVAFRDSDVQNELNDVMSQLEHADVVNLLIDLSASNYFGSTIIGALINMTEKIAERGGRSALCEASDEMEQVLRAMHVDRLWVIFDDKKEALRWLHE